MGKVNKTNSYTKFFYKTFRNILIISIPLVIISALILSLPHSSASTDQIEFSLSVSCTMSSVVNSAHTKEITNGTYHSDVGKTTITALCNDGNGYTVYATGYGNNEEGNNKLINSSYPQYSIDTGLATSGLTSQWAMKLSNIPDDPSSTPPVIESAYDDTYGLVPDNWTKVASRQSGTTDMNLGSSFTTTYSIYTSSSQFAGTYRGQVKYALLHPYKNDNVISLEDSFALFGKDKILMEGTTNEYYAMQDMSSDICDTAALVNEVSRTQLIDIRDNKLYWVAKLEDGKCWMTSNLDLEIGNTNMPLNSNTTDISTTASGSGIYAAGYTEQDGVWTWNPVSTAITSNYYIDNTTVKPSAWPTNNTGHTTPYSLEGGDTYYYTSNTTGDDTRYNSLQACKNASHTEDECKRYFAGNYYNWTAAIASNNSTNIGSTVGEIASNSICTKGWRLPNASQTDNVNNEFGRMLYGEGITAALSNGNNSVGYTIGGFNKLRSNPYYFVRSGSINGGTLGGSGFYGIYWSSAVGSSTYAYTLDFNGTDISPARNNVRYNGRSVRCVAR